MAKARAIVKRRKAVRNIKKITKTMQMIATAKFQKALKRAVGTKPFTLKVRELVAELAGSVGADIDHPLLRKVDARTATNKVALVVITANRGLAGAYNGNVLRAAQAFLRQQEAAGKTVELNLVGKEGITYFNYQSGRSRPSWTSTWTTRRSPRSSAGRTSSWPTSSRGGSTRSTSRT
jgi:F-type H+-transporting ATPase subunit gamma